MNIGSNIVNMTDKINIFKDHSEQNFHNNFKINTGKRVYFLKSQENFERDLWIEALLGKEFNFLINNKALIEKASKKIEDSI